jgi:hypothetical protein
MTSNSKKTLQSVSSHSYFLLSPILGKTPRILEIESTGCKCPSIIQCVNSHGFLSSIYPSIYLSIYQSIIYQSIIYQSIYHLSIYHLSIYLSSINLSIHPASFHQLTYLSIHPSITFLSTHPHTHPSIISIIYQSVMYLSSSSIIPSIHLSTYLSIHLFIYFLVNVSLCSPGCPQTCHPPAPAS